LVLLANYKRLVMMLDRHDWNSNKNVAVMATAMPVKRNCQCPAPAYP
jgi:hypothetical protein